MPAQNTEMAQSQPAAQPDDVGEWMARVKEVVAKPDILTAAPPQGAGKWHEDFFAFFDPVDTCFITWCAPCVTFGKTHHRLRKDPNLRDYNPLNASCIGFWLSSYFCCHWLPLLLQRHDIKTKYNLDGDFATDCLKAWCCGCCDLIQQDKEAAYQALNNPTVMTEQPTTKEAMTLPASTDIPPQN